jgi:ATP-dependent Clp protease adapter protein ClpS
MGLIVKMSSKTIELTIHQNIIDQINSIDGGYTIIAFNNDFTPFSLVFYVLFTVVPLPQREAYDKTLEIHTKGRAAIYKGSKDHCEKIGKVLEKINVEYEIE